MARANVALYAVFTISFCISILEYSLYQDIPALGIGLSSEYSKGSLNCSLYCFQCKSSYKPEVPPHEQGAASNTLQGIQFLDNFALHDYHDCVASKQALLMVRNQTQCYKRRSFLNRTTPIVALVSFPGSGNSWVRHILEQSTGILTGSIYCDTTLKASFPGEFIVSANVLAVKTHHGDSTYLPSRVQEHMGQKTKFAKAILIVRDPYDALVSEANRQWSKVRLTQKHHGIAGQQDFIGNPKWDWFVEYRGFKWYMMLSTWLKHSSIPVHVVQYERLKTNLAEEIVKMANFLNQNLTQDALKCVLSNSQGMYRRLKHLNFDPYSNQLKTITNEIIKKGNTILKEYGIKYDTR